MKIYHKFGLVLILTLLIYSAMSHNPNIRNLGSSSQSGNVLEQTIYVTQRDGNYYAYEVYSGNGKIFIELVDKDLSEYQFTFQSKDNTLYYRAAYNKFIIVQEKTFKNKSVTYWVLIIVKTTQGYALETYAVSSTIDNQNYQFDNQYLLSGVVEYNEQDQFLYVSMEIPPSEEYDVYGIDLGNKPERMITIGWFKEDKTNPQHIVGGNSRVLVEATKDQFWFDTRNKRMNDSDPTIYNKVNISSLTTLPIYSQGSDAYPFFSSYFQYVSLSQDKFNLTTFIFKGYEQISTVYVEGSVNASSRPIKIFSDEQTFFLAVADVEIYVSIVEWNAEKQDYEIYSHLLSQLISDECERQKWLQIFNSVILVVHSQRSFYMISETTFYVYSQTVSYEQPLNTPLDLDSDLEQVILSYMKAYLAAPSR